MNDFAAPRFQMYDKSTMCEYIDVKKLFGKL